MYAYVVDGYVGDWFRLLAYFVYSPLSVFLVILTAGPTLFGVEPLVLPALAAAGYANVQFREYLGPREPYYFGPESPDEFEAAVAAEATAGVPPETGAAEPQAGDAPTADSLGSTAGSTATESGPDPAAAQATEGAATAPAGEPAAAADSSERGILPQFMRRL